MVLDVLTCRSIGRGRDALKATASNLVFRIVLTLMLAIAAVLRDDWPSAMAINKAEWGYVHAIFPSVRNSRERPTHVRYVFSTVVPCF